MLRWMMALAGLFLAVFAVVALSGPGENDVADGYIRYEVARSLVEHGDVDIRDPKIWFTVFPGRDGRRYSNYRFPQSAAGVVAILAADATGPVSEARRQFFFSLTSAVASAVLAVTYAALFRRLGLGPRASLLWAAGGNLLHAELVLSAPAPSMTSSARPPWSWPSRLRWGAGICHPRAGAVAAGLALGLAFNCKEPLGIFVLPVMAALYDPGAGWRAQWGRLAIVPAMLAAGVAAYKGYDWYKFPPGLDRRHMPSC